MVFSTIKKNGVKSVITLIAIAWLYPIILIAINSFKPYNEIINAFLSLPSSISFAMYIETWVDFNFLVLFRNTIIYTVVTVIFIGIFAPMAAYKLSRVKTKLSYLIFFIIILPMMVPFQTYMITLTKFMGNLDLLGTRVGYIFANIGLCMPLAVFMIHGFVKNIPIELEESAYIDGASKLRSYIQITLPLLKPILITVLVIDTLAVWNDVIVNILILGGKPATLNIQNALYSKFSAMQSDWEHALPGLMISTIPNIIFFIFMQKYIVGGITAGAIKG
ncbi:carbohydrate ABC transporter permease [Vallitaleaceae bacterium 9-2]